MSPLPASSDFTAELAQRVVDAKYSDGDRHKAATHVIDTLAVALAGRIDNDAAFLRRLEHLEPEGGPASVWGTSTRVRPERAALLNATAAHVLDFDDVSHDVKGHPSAVLVPTLLAFAETQQISGHRLLDGYLSGYQAAAAVTATGVAEPAYARGWHMTSVVGVIAGVAALGRLAALSPQQLVHLMGIAVSCVSGTRQNFGTAMKSLQVGRAASAAVEAMTLLDAGVTASRTAVEGELGLLRMLAPDPAALSLGVHVRDLPGPCQGSGLAIKAYPCCYHAARPVDAAIELAPWARERLEDITEVVVEVTPGTTSALVHDDPTSPLEARFSGPYLVARALIDGTVDLDTFSPKALQERPPRDLMERVHFVERRSGGSAMASEKRHRVDVTIRTRHGEERSESVVHPAGSLHHPLSEAEFHQKLQTCLDWGGRPEGLGVLLHLRDALEANEGVAACMAEAFGDSRMGPS